MMVRAASGAIYIGVIIAGIFCGTYAFTLLVTVFAAFSYPELYRLFFGADKKLTPAACFDFVCLVIFIDSIGYMAASGLFNFNKYAAHVAMAIALGYVAIRMIMAVVDRSENPVRSFGVSAFAMLYIGVQLFWLLIAYIVGGSHGKYIVLGLFVFLWINDTGAYLCGRTFGRHKLCERLSPKKTWEGFWGGFVLTAIAGAVYSSIIGCTGSQIAVWALVAAAVSVFGTFGDLFESLLKRHFGVKDSGTLIPGHGGILDRIDSLLAVTPFAMLLTLFV